jgi:hypothetical protein
VTKFVIRDRVTILWIVRGIALVLRSVTLTPMIIVLAFHLFIIIAAILSIGQQWIDLESGAASLLAKFGIDSFSVSLSGNEAERFLVGTYVTIAFWTSVLLELLGLILRRKIHISTRTKTAMFVTIVAMGSIAFAALSPTTPWGRLGIVIGSALVSGLSIGIPFMMIGAFKEFEQLLEKDAVAATAER